MRFLFKKDKRDSREIVISVIIENGDITEINFKGKGLYGINPQEAPDNFLIDSFYDVVEKYQFHVPLVSRYVAPEKINGTYYTKTFEGSKYKLNHNIDSRREMSQYSPVNPGYGNEPETIEGKSILYMTVLQFMQSNKNYISFESKEEREKFNNFFDDNFISVSEVEENEKLKNIINTNLGEYQTKGNKFLFFTKPPERAEVIQELTKNIRSICDKKFLYASDYEEIAKLIIAAREKVIVSHKANSVLGSWGITSSRLAESLNKCLTDMMSSRLLSKNTVEKLEKQNEQNRILKI